MEAPKWRRQKTAKERRDQQLRSDARCMARLVKGLLGVAHHRGNTLSVVGRHLLAALQQGEGHFVQNVSVGNSMRDYGRGDGSGRQQSCT